MKLYISCSNASCKHNIHINGTGRNRQELANSIGYTFNVTCPFCYNNGLYNVTNVFAGLSDLSTHAPKAFGGSAGGAIAGGLIAGPPGMLIGIILGFFTGGGISNNSEKKAIETFNNS